VDAPSESISQIRIPFLKAKQLFEESYWMEGFLGHLNPARSGVLAMHEAMKEILF
jgi:hypothetical protein